MHVKFYQKSSISSRRVICSYVPEARFYYGGVPEAAFVLTRGQILLWKNSWRLVLFLPEARFQYGRIAGGCYISYQRPDSIMEEFLRLLLFLPEARLYDVRIYLRLLFLLSKAMHHPEKVVVSRGCSYRITVKGSVSRVLRWVLLYFNRKLLHKILIMQKDSFHSTEVVVQVGHCCSYRWTFSILKKQFYRQVIVVLTGGLFPF